MQWCEVGITCRIFEAIEETFAYKAPARCHRQKMRLVGDEYIIILEQNVRFKGNFGLVFNLPKIVQLGTGSVIVVQADGFIRLVQNIAAFDAVLPNVTGNVGKAFAQKRQNIWVRLGAFRQAHHGRIVRASHSSIIKGYCKRYSQTHAKTL